MCARSGSGHLLLQWSPRSVQFWAPLEAQPFSLPIPSAVDSASNLAYLHYILEFGLNYPQQKESLVTTVPPGDLSQFSPGEFKAWTTLGLWWHDHQVLNPGCTR